MPSRRHQPITSSGHGTRNILSSGHGTNLHGTGKGKHGKGRDRDRKWGASNLASAVQSWFGGGSDWKKGGKSGKHGKGGKNGKNGFSLRDGVQSILSSGHTTQGGDSILGRAGDVLDHILSSGHGTRNILSSGHGTNVADTAQSYSDDGATKSGPDSFLTGIAEGIEEEEEELQLSGGASHEADYDDHDHDEAEDDDFEVERESDEDHDRDDDDDDKGAGLLPGWDL